MRITLRIVAAGKCWSIIGLPSVDLKRCYPVGANGERFDESAFRAAVRNHHNIQFADGDGGCVCAFAALLLSSLGEWYDDMDKNDGTSESVTRGARTIARRYRRGVGCRVRIDLKPIRYQPAAALQPVWTVEVRIRTIDEDCWDAPSSDRFDRYCAMIVADFCQSYSRKFVERGNAPLVFASETAALLAELKARREEEHKENQAKQ